MACTKISNKLKKTVSYADGWRPCSQTQGKKCNLWAEWRFKKQNISTWLDITSDLVFDKWQSSCSSQSYHSAMHSVLPCYHSDTLSHSQNLFLDVLLLTALKVLVSLSFLQKKLFRSSMTSRFTLIFVLLASCLFVCVIHVCTVCMHWFFLSFSSLRFHTNMMTAQFHAESSPANVAAGKIHTKHVMYESYESYTCVKQQQQQW